MAQLIYAQPVKDMEIKNIHKELESFTKIPNAKIIFAEGFSSASSSYVSHKVSDCNEARIDNEVVKLDWENRDKEYVLNQIIELIKIYNADDNVTGYIVQLPLPYGIVEKDFVQYIDPIKDLDGFTCENLGAAFKRMDSVLPATPYGVIKYLEHYNIPLAGKDVLVVNRSQIVGIGLLPLLIERDATVTIAHSKTVDLADKIKRADIVILGVGRKDFITDPNAFKDGAVVVDVSINRDEDGKLYGDLSKSLYESDKDITITPVPKGVGVTTRLALLLNIIECAKMQEKKR